jgi:stearoyl-CoA desaturase (delta-9 desaturase)
MHHRFSDRPGDPHSPHLESADGWRGAFRGLVHAHAGWLFRASDRACPERYAPDLMSDPAMRWIDKTFVLWVLVGLAVPFGLGVALMGTVTGGLEALLWGGAVRILILHHATFSINSLCHFFGKRNFSTDDESRNLAWLSLLTFGEAWHNNHHAFPTSAHHGLKRWQLDPGGWLIEALALTGLVWDVVRISPAAQHAKLRPSSA